MFAALFASAFEFLLFVAAIVIVYQIFLSDWIYEKRNKRKESKGKASSVDKLGKVKLVSDDPKDIEMFVTDNAQYLSDQMVTKLVARIEYLKADKVITADEVLKQRIEELEPIEGDESNATAHTRNV